MTPARLKAHWTQPFWTAFLVALATLAVTLFYWQTSEKAIRVKRQQAFDAAADQTIGIIHQHLANYELVMRGVKGLIESSDDVNRDEYRNYIDSLRLSQNGVGLQGVAVALHVTQANRARHVADMQARGFASYRLKPCLLYTSRCV